MKSVKTITKTPITRCPIISKMRWPDPNTRYPIVIIAVIGPITRDPKGANKKQG
jgi:hypothetical protein